MRIQLVFLLLFSMSAFASDESDMQELFKKYDLVMDYKKVEYIDEIFTDRFLKSSGGKEEFIEKVKDLTTPSDKSLIPKTTMSWKKGQKEGFFFATLKEVSSNKAKPSSHGTQFIVIKENGKLKIDGTLSDDN